MTRPKSFRVLGGLVTLWGLIALAWQFFGRPSAGLFADPPIAGGAALGLILLGGMTVSLDRDTRRWRLGRLAACAALTLIMVAGLDLRLTGAGSPDAFGWLIGPDRVRAADGLTISAALAFLCGGWLVVLTDWGERRLLANLAQIAGTVMGLLALTGLITDWLGLDQVHGGSFGALGIATAAPLLTLAGAVWLHMRHAAWFEALYLTRPERRLTVVSAGVVLVITLASGAMALGVMQARAEASLRQLLVITAQARIAQFSLALDEDRRLGRNLAAQPGLIQALTLLEEHKSNATAQVMLADALQQLTDLGFTQAVIYNTSADQIASVGHGEGEVLQAAPVRGVDPSSLIWRDGLVLSQRVPIASDGRPLGMLVIDRPLPEMTRQLLAPIALGDSAEEALCKPFGQGVSCFPTRLSAKSIMLPLVSVDASARLDALEARDVTDFDGKQLIVTSAPIGDTGLYLVLKLDADELFRPVRHDLNRVLPMIFVLIVVGTVVLRATVEPMAKRLRQLATTDGLTRVLNRRTFLERGARLVDLARRHNHRMTLLMLDADHFKRINDSYGHETGDEVLKALAGLCQQSLRSSDLIGRMGGEEFAIVLAETGLEQGLSVAERLRQDIAACATVSAKGQIVHFSVSIGVSTLGLAVDDIAGLLRRADAALYQAKSAGRNRVVADC